MIRNVTKERLAAGELAIGIGLRQARTVDIGKIMKTAGFDFLFIDMEHNSMSIDLAAQISVAAQDAGITPIVRAPGLQHFHATRALDTGAQGVVVPHIDTPEQAAEVVDHCKYPPLGHRSVTGALPQLNFEAVPLSEAAQAINASTLVIVMLETPNAIENAGAIAAIRGIDVLLIGSNDLAMEMGIPGQVDHPRLAKAYETMIAACEANGKFAGLGGVYHPPLMARYIAMGFRLVLAGSDLSLLLAAARERAAAVRAMMPG